MESVESWESTDTGLSRTLSPTTYWKTAELSDSRHNKGEILKNEFNNNLKNREITAYLAEATGFQVKNTCSPAANGIS